MNEYAWNQDIEDDDETELDPRSLPKQLRQMLAAAKKEAADQRAENATLKGELRVTNIASVLESKGVSKKVAKLIPADVETSLEAIETWLKDYEDVFGQPSASAQTTTVNPVVESLAGVTPDDQIAAIQRIQNTTATSQPSGSRNDAIMAKLADPATTEDEILAMIKNGGL